ncbi:unnamed protein product [Miscanthus lutarioriparius]|uniref:Uncharacterized protein n=1 Tax=Miscanthus lutarioriparius TaxID=422564 RepID=A0A811PEG4_9POAL|nr:unnamed protein product [Miscanthus lutarioriparius]
MACLVDCIGWWCNVLLELVPPPAVSTAFIDRALLPAAAAWDTASCRVEGADASGHLLLAFPSPRAPGESNLLVCRPVPSSSGGAGKAKGKWHFLPAFPEDVLGLSISPAAPTGIIADHGANTGDAYFVAQVQSAPSSTPVVAVALCFSSDDSKWTVREVAGDDRWRDFHANSMVSHDRGVHSDGLLVFVDMNHGLLLFHPWAIASRFVQFPDPPEGGGGGETEEEADASVDSSEGKIIYVVMTGMVFAVRCPADGTPKRSWMETVNSAVQDGKQVGMIALSAVQKGRKYADKLPGAVQKVNVSNG